jgi:AbrB family looped-hinge helix DNA binding protein
MGVHSAKVTSKGQITLPAQLRVELGIKPGDRVDFQRNDAGRMEMTARTTSIMDLRGIVKGVRLTPVEIVRAVDAARTARAKEIVERLRSRRK